MSYIALPYPFNVLSAEEIENLFVFSDTRGGLLSSQLSTLLTPKDDASQLNSALSAGNKGVEQLSQHLSEESRQQILATLRYQIRRAYEIKFTFKAPKKGNFLQQSIEKASVVGLKQVSNEESRQFILPYDPLLSVRMKNKIISKIVAQQPQKVPNTAARGSIKERWGLQDVEVDISGVLLFEKRREYPLGEVRLLHKLLREGDVKVKHLMLNSMGIHHLVIQSIELPPTKGGNQKYRIRAISDTENYDFLQEDKANVSENAVS